MKAFLNRVLNQTAVYWGAPAQQGDGSFTFDDPVEIKCRWEDKEELSVDDEGNEIVVKSTVFVNQDLDKGGYLVLAELDDLSSNPDDPRTEGAYMIRQKFSYPSVQGINEYKQVKLSRYA